MKVWKQQNYWNIDIIDFVRCNDRKAGYIMKIRPLQIGNLMAKIPIVQGGMGIGISLGNLAGAVASAGGVGTISAAQIGFLDEKFLTNPREANLEAIEREYQKARAIAPEGIIGFNIMVAMKYYKEYVKQAIKAGADFIVSGAGLPLDLPAYVEGCKTKIAPIVSTAKSARVILKSWDRKYKRTADMVVVEGPEAGGHLGFTIEQLAKWTPEAYKQEIKDIIEAVKVYEDKYDHHIPIVLGGGISDAKKVQEAFSLGIDAVQVATKFITTKECDADIKYKQAYVKAQKSDVAIVKSPVGMPGRALLNQFIERVAKGEKFPPKRCKECLGHCNPKEIPYCITERLIAAATGENEEALLFCGAQAYEATKIETVSDVIDSLFEEIVIE